MPTERRCGAGNEGADQHRERREQRQVHGRFARRVGGLAGFRFGLFGFRDHFINSFLCILLAQARPRRDELGEIGFVGCRYVSGTYSTEQNAYRRGARLLGVAGWLRTLSPK